jgi:acetyl-CoA carboxylase biotin carboxyl carrier protein
MKGSGQMKLDDIVRVMDAARDTGFDTVEIKDGDFYIRLERGGIRQAAPAEAPAAASPEAPAAAGPRDEGKPGGGMPDARDITSPLVGIFHERAGSPVRMGDQVKKGEVICLVEAMKLMNEIQMPEDGEIAWIAVEEGSTVEYGQILFRYAK